MLDLVLAGAVAAAMAAVIRKATRGPSPSATRGASLAPVRPGWSPRQLRKIPRTTISLAGDGETVCLVGYLVGPPPLVAPVTDRPCFFWRLEAQLGDDPDRTHARESSPVSIVTLRDDTGTATVDLSGATIVIDRGAGLRLFSAARGGAAGAAFLRRHGIEPQQIAPPVHLREGALTSDDPIVVVGHAVRVPDPGAPDERGYRDLPPTRLHLAGARRRRLHVTDDPLLITPDVHESPR